MVSESSPPTAIRVRARSPQVPDQRISPPTLSAHGPVAPPPSVAVTVIVSSPSAFAARAIRTAQPLPDRAADVAVVGGPVSSRPPGVRVTARTDTVYGAAHGSPVTGGSDVAVVVRVVRTPVAEIRLTS